MAVSFTAAQSPPVSPLTVVTTLQPWASLSAAVGGDLIDVDVLLPPGASPHSFDPSPSQAVTLARADLVIMNGGLDDWLHRLLEATASEATRVNVLESFDHDALASADETHGGGDHGGEHAHDHSSSNSHVWLDPTLAAQGVAAIAAALKALDPVNETVYERNASVVVGRLIALDEELRALLSPFAGVPIVPFHDAWVHFASRYDLDIVATIEPFPGREPSASYVTAAVERITTAGVAVIFTEGQLSDRTAHVVAESAGVRLATLDPLGGAPGPLDYFELLRWNAAVIAKELRDGR